MTHRKSGAAAARIAALCLVLLLSFCAAPDARSAGGYFGPNARQNINIFMAADQWEYSLARASDYCSEHGLEASYRKLLQDFNHLLAGRRLQDVSVSAAKDVFAQAVFLAFDHRFSLRELDEMVSSSRLRTLENVIAQHREGESRYVKPEDVVDKVCNALGMTTTDAKQLFKRLIPIFSRLYR
ncbi:MAG: hypothetical protein Q4F72_04500 [Desulfovibrionaceae bacterium]|nr:hypothetical protein [Desulfovibrionaceae bacterium]